MTSRNRHLSFKTRKAMVRAYPKQAAKTTLAMGTTWGTNGGPLKGSPTSNNSTHIATVESLALQCYSQISTARHPALVKGGQCLWPFGQQHHHQGSQAKERRQNVEVPGITGLAEPIFGFRKMTELTGSKNNVSMS